MRILGVDPGTKAMGWAVIDYKGEFGLLLDIDLVESGVFRPGKQDMSLSEKLFTLYILLQEQFKDYMVVSPGFVAEVAVEDIPFIPGNRRDTLLRLGNAQAIPLILAGLYGVPAALYKPSQVKMAATGIGNASKDDVLHAVKAYFGLPTAAKEEMTYDEADAIAVALAHVAAVQERETIAGRERST